MNIKEFNTFNKSKFTRTCYDINSILKINTWRRGGWYSTIRFLIITNLRSRSIRCVSAESQLLKLGLLIFSIFFVLLHSSIHYIYYSIIKSCRSLLHPVILGVGKYMFSSYRDFTYTILIYIMSSICQ